MFLEEHKIFRAEQDVQGNVIFEKNGHAKLTELSAEEKANMQVGAGGQARVGINGIFNNADDAAYYAGRHNSGMEKPLHIVSFPPADSIVGELMVAGYQTFLENDLWGMTGSGREVKELMKRYSTDGLVLEAHRRGSLTVGNAMESLKNEGGAIGSLMNTDIESYGPPMARRRRLTFSIISAVARKTTFLSKIMQTISSARS